MDETRDEWATQDLGTRQGAETRLDGRSSTDDVTLRFGPGVPAAVAEQWRRKRVRQRRPPARRIAGSLLTLGLAVLTGLVVWWLLRGGPEVEVTGVQVTAPTGVQKCGATVTVIGVLRTNGGQGDVSYRWRRSDGQISGIFTDSVPRGRRSIRVPLRWTVQGSGSLHAVATLEVLAPKGSAGASSSGAFDYECG
jgi:hypothetical protein